MRETRPDDSYCVKTGDRSFYVAGVSKITGEFEKLYIVKPDNVSEVQKNLYGTAYVATAEPTAYANSITESGKIKRAKPQVFYSLMIPEKRTGHNLNKVSYCSLRHGKPIEVRSDRFVSSVIAPVSP